MTKKTNRGQALTEYVILIMVIAGMFSLVLAYMPQLFTKLEKPVTDSFRRAYKFGHPKACGDEPEPGTSCDGNAVMHPRISSEGNFRLWARWPQ